MKGVTAKKSCSGEVETSDYSMPIECFNSVGGATRVVATTRGKQWRYSHLVPTNKQNEERAHRSACNPGGPPTNLSNISIQFIKRRIVRLGFRPYEQINSAKVWQQGCSHQFAQTSFDPISVNDLVSMFGYHDANPWMQKQRS